MKIDYETQSLHENLNKLSPWQAAVFSACCAERLLPNYALFSREVGWGDPKLLRNLLDSCWDAISHASEDKIVFELNIRLCDSITPDTEDFVVPSISMALDAAIAVRCTLECLRFRNSEQAKNASRCALDTVDMYLRGKAIEKGLDHNSELIFIESHPLLLHEIEAQNGTIDILNTLPDKPKRACDDIRMRCFNQGISNLGYS